MMFTRQLCHSLRGARRMLPIGVVVCIVALWITPTASAACSRAVREDSLATQQVVAQLVAAQSPAADDVHWLYERARRSCLDIRPARAIATVTLRLGVPAANQRARVLGVDLIGLHVGADLAWRMDLARTAARYARATSSSAQRQYRAQLAAASWGAHAVTYAADPTKLSWDPGQQSAIVAALGRSTSPQARRMASAGVRAFGVGSRTASLARLPTLQHLVIATRVLSGVDGTPPTGVAGAVARDVAARAMLRVRTSRARAWSRIDGEWSTAAEHRALLKHARLLVRRVPNAATSTAIGQLQRALGVPARVSFVTLPTGAFYPTPRDGAFDTQSVVIDIDKPALVTLLIYGADGARVHAATTRVVPGRSTLAWDGTIEGGAAGAVGAYRYNVDARDLAGNRIRVPGLQQFEIARDTDKPVVVTASLRIVGTAANRRAIASWNVTETHSPQVKSWLILRSGSESSSIALHDSIQQATVRRALTVAPGTWTATMVFIDGSGNRTQHRLGSYKIR